MSAYSLFPDDPIYPEGFEYLPGFITRAEEQELLKVVKNVELHTFLFQGYEAKRRVASFGYDYSFDTRTVSKGKEIPHEFNWLIKKVADHLSIKAEDFAELLVTEYPVGSVINWHRDAPPFDIIAGISLLSGCTFKLRPHEKSKQSRSATISLPVEPRSLYIMQGPSRSDWQHSISPVKAVRYSVTLRTMRG